jgi:hypothetical protein
MSIWGDQWLCRCGYRNVVVRKCCRNCGESQNAAIDHEDAFGVLVRFKSKEEVNGTNKESDPPQT